jgi:cytochrome P450
MKPVRALSKPFPFDINALAFKRDPLPTLAAMREAGPIIPIKLPLLGRVWATTTYMATAAMMKDNALFVQEAGHAGKSGISGLALPLPKSLRLLAENMLLKDEPDHRRLRTLVDQAFQRRGILEMRGDIEHIADDLIDSFDGRSGIDLVHEYSRQLPLAVICELLGLPAADRRTFSEWAEGLTVVNTAFDVFRLMGAARKMVRYLREQIEMRRRTPGPGLIGELVRAEADGHSLSEDELVAMVLISWLQALRPQRI